MNMKLDQKASVLVAVGAATAANCTSCLEKTVSVAREIGADEEEIGEAVEIGRRVRVGAGAKLDQFATSLSSPVVHPPPSESGGCALHRLIRRIPRNQSAATGSTSGGG